MIRATAARMVGMIRSRSPKTVSLVIPAHNEEELLPRDDVD
jgi:hypothetical protein